MYNAVCIFYQDKTKPGRGIRILWPKLNHSNRGLKRPVGLRRLRGISRRREFFSRAKLWRAKP